ncbi:GNAT family N-acetyltransferase [Christiangramia salexigens]|uniref:GNAT family N-acetyltransferase n=2 Tax=Christiangramia salexigens TaxID=1913577 RepID=A0A1L3J8G8_9FLAO|nr:GNAT family N-acetyltransferase [Christiangramia salexigens]APG61410.1 GNAT family N-acetyltransferase [Christiangramia salexigens]
MEIKHKENDNRGMFYIENDVGLIGELTYFKKDDIITIDHTEVKRELENRGIGSELIRRSVEFARHHKLKIDPLCPFAEVQFDRHQSYQDVRAT